MGALLRCYEGSKLVFICKDDEALHYYYSMKECKDDMTEEAHWRTKLDDGAFWVVWLKPMECIYIPPGKVHKVLTLEPSICMGM